MKSLLTACLTALLVAVASPAQVVYIDDNNPTLGTSNAFPWGQAAGFTTLHVYTAAQLIAGGVSAGAVLTDIAVAPSSGTSGIYNAPQARLTVGHLANNPIVAGLWESNLQTPTVIHDLTSGPYSFPWTLNTWVPLPGVCNAGFVWDGATDIGIFYTSSAATTGTFSAHRTATNLRHALNIFNATTQTPQSNGNFAMKVRLTFGGVYPLYQVNQPASSLDIDGIQGGACTAATVTRGLGVTFNLGLQSTNVGLGWELAYTYPDALVPAGGGALVFPTSQQMLNLNLGSAGFGVLNGLTLPPFPGNIVLPLQSTTPITLSAQMLVLDAVNPDGFALSAGVQLTVN